MTDIDISVCVLAYNHEPYIREALLSVLGQNTKYSIEVLVLEDCSTDNTLSIVKAISTEYPGRIKIRANSKNKGHFLNLREGFKGLKGKYVAILDGDDYWDHPEKLEKQISFLEDHPEYIGAAHNVRLKYSDGKEELFHKPDQANTITLEDLICAKTYLHTSSLVHKNIFKDGFPPSYFEKGTGDWFLSMLYAEHGPITYINEVMSVYRIHHRGLWSSLSDLEKKIANIDAAVLYNKLFAYKYAHWFDQIVYYVRDVLKENVNDLSFFNYIKYKSLYYGLILKHPERPLWHRILGYFFRGLFMATNKIYRKKI